MISSTMINTTSPSIIYGVNCLVNPIALRKAKIVYNFSLSECKRVKPPFHWMALLLHFKILAKAP